MDLERRCESNKQKDRQGKERKKEGERQRERMKVRDREILGGGIEIGEGE